MTRPADDGSAVVGATASTGVADVLRGSRRRARVLAAFPAALYLEHDDGLLALVSPDGIAHPNAVVLAQPVASPGLTGHAPGTVGHVGDLGVALPGLHARVTRWFDPRPRLRPVRASVLATRSAAALALVERRAGPTPELLATRLRELVAASTTGDVAVTTAVARRLVGLGPGLTPAGDDVLAGLFAGTPALAAALGRPHAPSVTALRGVADRVLPTVGHATTAVSAALLRHAARGEVAAPAAAVLRALTAAEVPDAVPSDGTAGPALCTGLDDLLAVGSTSGRDLALGLLAAAEVLLHEAAPRAAAAASRPLHDLPPIRGRT
ncbi:DUF2877 domain-containing protein [Egicoccus sp. AB-alg2]|uniref:oxamate carbamoyltransferase subunit AllH family protein n=1 Tax=Egicoccus sp. AB-alg2 TaxID=3242693 RepID=UPI00359EE2DB